MANIYKLDILSPEGTVFSGNVQSASFPTQTGIITILANHTSLITKLDSGEVEITEENGEKKFIAIMGGFIEVSNNIVSVIASFAIRSEEIDEMKVNEAKKYAEEQIKRKDKISSAMAEHDLQKAILELKVFNHSNLKKRNKGVKF